MDGNKEKLSSENDGTKILTVVAAAIGLSAYAWNLSFNFGAFGVIFLDHIIAIWLFSLSILMATVIIQKRILPGNKWRGYLILLLPTIWLIFRIMDDPSVTGRLTDHFLHVLSILSIVISLPYLAYLFFYFTNPNIIQLKNKYLASLVGFILFIALIGYVLGSHNYFIMNCQEFIVSGQDTPTNCLRLDKSEVEP